MLLSRNAGDAWRARDAGRAVRPLWLVCRCFFPGNGDAGRAVRPLWLCRTHFPGMAILRFAMLYPFPCMAAVALPQWLCHALFEHMVDAWIHARIPDARRFGCCIDSCRAMRVRFGCCIDSWSDITCGFVASIHAVLCA